MFDCLSNAIKVVTLCLDLLDGAETEEHCARRRTTCLDGSVEQRAGSPGVSPVGLEVPIEYRIDACLVEAALNGVLDAREDVSYLTCCRIKGFDAGESPLRTPL